ncbi:MAG: glucosyl transferase [Thermonema sp.]|uniref:glycosyltransferase family 2 protein n=1 Tax=Thermonema sp. TaxID=2231181 RepID=UPI0021DE8074|nr:glycosyltransferase family 2 protein [Thermonema sp.]GIV38423.1 MAG: glucosyl transferase [Thermonema sp.]
MASTPTLSIVSPVFEAEGVLPALLEQLHVVMARIGCPFEIILIDDGSSDGSWPYMQAQASKHAHIKAVRLSRNFGQHHAITAGLDIARGEWVVVMDCDLEDPPEAIASLWEAAMEGNCDMVLARRVQRRHAFYKQAGGRLFYRLLHWLSGRRYDPSIANFGIYHRKVVDTLRRMREPVRFFPAMVQWTGFKAKTLDIKHRQRPDGRHSTYDLRKLLRLAVDVMLAQSARPMWLVIQLGLGLAALAFLFSIITLVRYFLGYITVLGYASLIISIWFLAGVLLMCMGLLGLYIGKIFEGIQGRPLYVISETVNVQTHEHRNTTLGQ